MNALTGTSRRKPQGKSKNFPDTALSLQIISDKFLCRIIYPQGKEKVAKDLNPRSVQIQTLLQLLTPKPLNPKERYIMVPPFFLKQKLKTQVCLLIFTYWWCRFLKRQTTTAAPKRKFPTLAEIKEETDPIPDEVNSILLSWIYSTLRVGTYLMFLYFRLQTNPLRIMKMIPWTSPARLDLQWGMILLK